MVNAPPKAKNVGQTIEYDDEQLLNPEDYAPFKEPQRAALKKDAEVLYGPKGYLVVENKVSERKLVIQPA